MPSGRIILKPDARSDNVSFTVTAGPVVLGPSTVTYAGMALVNGRRRWVSVPLADVRRIEWDGDPFDQPGDEIAFLRQFIANLSEDELEAAIEAQIGLGGLDRQGAWIKAALMEMVA